MRKNRPRAVLEQGAASKKKQISPELRSVAISAALGLGVMAVLIFLCGLLLSAVDVPLAVVSPTGLVIGCAGAAASGFACSRFNREKGFFYGLLCAGVLFAALFISGLSLTGQPPTFYTAIKLFSMLICGALGGSFGVNLKRKW